MCALKFSVVYNFDVCFLVVYLMSVKMITIAGMNNLTISKINKEKIPRMFCVLNSCCFFVAYYSALSDKK